MIQTPHLNWAHVKIDDWTTIIIKSVGKVAFFTSSFSSYPAPGPMLIKTLMFVRVIVLLYSNIE